MDKLPHALLEAIGTLLAGLVPGAIGATVTLAWERGLTWGQRFLQLAVGTVVSFYAARMIGALWHGVDAFMLDGVKFTIGMIAFKATPRFIGSAVEVAAGLPALIRDRYFPKGE
jgi:hypothetical protein